MNPEIVIAQGKLRGSLGVNLDGSQYFSFEGVPYAKPPVGPLRFKAPVAPEPWVGTFDGTHEGSPSCCNDLVTQKYSGSEDCLILNVFTKKVFNDGKIDKGLLKPVLFFIHGGGFFTGSSSKEFYGPEFLMTRDVVLVTINYRLGLLGFLSVDDPELNIPGNAGLKDQVMALKWVQNNIANFGGDPNNVTIFGESAGGASVHLLVLSPLTKGLIHKAIAHSGCALFSWSKAGDSGRLLRQQLNLTDDKSLLDYLNTLSGEELVEIQQNAVHNIMSRNKKFVYGFVVEENPSATTFLSEEPIDLVLKGKYEQVPFIFGVNSAEWMLVDTFKMIQDPKDEILEAYIPTYFGSKPGSAELKKLTERLKKFYFGDEDPTKNPRPFYIAIGDLYFYFPSYLAALVHAKKSKTNVYFYMMEMDTALNFFKINAKITEPGVSHMDELGYLFKTSWAPPNIEPGSTEDTCIRKMLSLWTNFAAYGNPTPIHSKDKSLVKVDWEPIGKEFKFLNIDQELQLLTDPEKERVDFWVKLFLDSTNGKKFSQFFKN